MRIIIFGVGQFYNARKELFYDDEVVAFIDNDSKNQGKIIDGKKVSSIKSIYEHEYDYICIMTGYKYLCEIKKQLIIQGIDEKKIVSFYELFSKKEKKNIQLCIKNGFINNDICFLLANLNNTGGFRAALYAIQAIKECGYSITVITTCYGNGYDELVKKDIDLVVTQDISTNNLFVMDLLYKAKCVFINSINFSYFIPFISEIENIIWWIHTGKIGYKNSYVPSTINECTNVRVFCVSGIACAEFKKNIGGLNANILPFGIPEETFEKKEKVDNKLIFALIGYIVPIKGVDVLVDAVKRLTEEEKGKCEFWIIGSTPNKSFYEELLKETDNITCIKWFGYKDHSEVIDMLRYVDVLISASREDMLPIVITEAFMNKIACIVSDAVGTTDFINDYENGIIFKNGNYIDLSEKIKWCIKNRSNLEYIGNKGRKLYEKEFSFKTFQERLEKIIGEMIADEKGVPSL